jgi:hypothetical protein
MSTQGHIPRRTFLRGLGTAVALPMLNAMVPAKALANLSAAGKPPIRMGFLFVPNGVHMQEWTPQATGANFDLPRVLKPLQAHRRDLLVLTGLTNDKGRGNGDGAGDHARSAGSFITGVQPLKSEGAEIRAGVSADQIAAKAIGDQTRFASLELGTESGRQAGKCDSGYSCAYSNNISWRDAATPMAKETNPRAVFERLFGNQLAGEMSESQAKRQRYKKSILDFVLEDARSLSAKVGGQDKQKLDEYLTAVREIETRIQRAEKDYQDQTGFLADYQRPAGIPDSYEDHMRLMGDMMVLAFQADVTRISTFMLANEGSNKSYPFINVREGHHTLSHHGNDADKLEKISRINEFHIRQFNYVLGRLKAIPEGDGCLLDNCMIVYGAGISDGNRHNNENLPVIVAGGGGGTLQSGRHIRYHNETPMANLMLSMLDRMGAPIARFGDSTGRLPHLEG